MRNVCTELSSADVLMWAEVVSTAVRPDPSEDSRARADGRMAIRLLSSMDCPLLGESDMLLEQGHHIAIVDFRVFVPEVSHSHNSTKLSLLTYSSSTITKSVSLFLIKL